MTVALTPPKPVILCILDGWGLAGPGLGNAPASASTPAYDAIMATCPHATLVTHGPDVGLPGGQMGNSEVGHTNIGAGRVVAMDLGQIDRAIEDGSFAANPALVAFVARLRETGGTAHLLGMVSDGGVHGHLDHLAEAARVIAGAGVPVVLHAVTDGRDVGPTSAEGFLARLEAGLPHGARIASVIGRYWAFDRDLRWDRIARAYRAILGAEGAHAGTAAAALAAARARGETDEFVAPTLLPQHPRLRDGDGVFCLSFRTDRAREILSALGEPGFAAFETGPRPRLAMLGLVDYSPRHDGFMTAMFPKRPVTNTLGAWVARHGLRQIRIAETEKYPHVTFFLNGGREAPEPGEDRAMPPSSRVATYDLLPAMSAAAVTDRLVEAIGQGYDLIVVNYANPDMVGHTGVLEAAIRACEAVDAGLGRVAAAVTAAGGAMVLAADHGNCEMMIDPVSGGPHTAHTTNRVPVAVLGGPAGSALADGRLADLAPTVLDLMRLPLPPEMTGRSLIRRPGATQS